MQIRVKAVPADQFTAWLDQQQAQAQASPNPSPSPSP